jgi:prepilin-type N-terminal cleavage/methylation domain-containing protein
MKTIGNLRGRLKTRKAQQAGFNLLELIVAMLIIGIVSSFSIPVFQRSMVQGQVDRYMQNLESGLFQLRARMGVIKISCDINFAERRPLLGGSRSQATTSTFYPPDQILEIQQSDGTRANSTNVREDALYKGCRCREYDSDNDQCTELVPKADALRFVNKEGTPEADNVLVSVSTLNYSFTPPGTSASNTDLVIRIKPAQAVSKVQERCVEVTGNGTIFTGSWESNSCKKR